MMAGLRMGLWALSAAAIPLWGMPAAAKEPTAEQTAFFEQTVRPILAENCYKCHSHSADKIKANFVLDSLAGLLAGGDTGPAIVRGQPEKSLLITAIRYTEENLQMPPKGKKLSAQQIEALERWVKMGAPWPGGESAKVAVKSKISDEDRQWWAFQPVRKPEVPFLDGDAWSRNEIDRFIRARLESEGLTPAPEADRRTLIRRLYFNLWGLPPSPEEIRAFLSDESEDAYERLVERLLESPRYGERWARHWLDLVRYAESDGYRVDDYRPHSWRYRDWVIQSLNEDKPYDRFVREQLAGDEIDPDNPEMLVANMYLRHWIYEYNNRDVLGQWETILNDITDVTGDVFLGMGVQCARCHDHKFDPILQKDYYRLRAFFEPILPRQDLVLATPQERNQYGEKLARWSAMASDVLKQIEEIEQPHREKAAEAAITKFPEDIQELIRKPVEQRTPREHQLAELAYRQVHYEYDRLDSKIKGAEKERLVALRKESEQFDEFKPKPLPPAFTVTDVGATPPPTYIFKGRKPDPVEPGYLTVLEEGPAEIAPPAVPESTGRRSELARWLTQPDNPLTARVIVNRIWQYHFGTGLVRTSSDFGTLGEKPSHPELLDWLAARFVEDGWSFKELHRLILTSATYRQAAFHPDPALARMKDPENRFCWRMSIRRLDAEQIRDAILATTGELDLTMSGPSVDSSKPRRTIYTKVIRNTRDPLLDVFDAPESFSSTAQRNVTTTPPQALLMFNSQLMLEHAVAFARRLEQSSFAEPEQLVAAACLRALGREPSPEELESALAFLREQSRRIPAPKPRPVPFLADQMPYREGKAAVLTPGSAQERFEVPDAPSLPDQDFTVEAFILLKSLYDDASVRTIASKWDGNKTRPGWAFGVTSRKSSNKPQTLVLQLIGEPGEGAGGYEAIFSGLQIELNRPYYVAVSVRLADVTDGGVRFYSKDLSNDEEPLQVGRAAHKVITPIKSSAPFVMGGRAGDAASHLWDGLIDDVRLTRGVLAPEQLLLNAGHAAENTVGYWQFDSAANKDSSGRGNDIRLRTAASRETDPQIAALIDFCHVLLNANEFLYVE